MTSTAPRQRLDLRTEIARSLSEILRLPFADIGEDTPFASLGLDSLAAAELTADLEDVLDVRLPVTAVYDFPTIASLAAFLEGDEAVASGSSFEQMRADAELPDDIRPCFVGGHARTDAAESILLTGATGFLGAHVLHRLLEESTASIVCLVRGAGGTGLARVKANLARYGLRTHGSEGRVRVVEGDLAAPFFGLTRRAFDELAASVQAVIHVGASVDWVQSYASLRGANVFGTREVLRLACTGVPKPVHFVSSISTCYSTIGPRTIEEGADALPGLEGIQLGYAQSKCVAESLVREAGRRGLPVSIIRPALVSGDSVYGRTNVDDLLTRFIAGCIAMGAAPDLDWRVDCLPADHVARAIVRSALAHDGTPATLHISADRPRHWRECVLWMHMCGYPMALLPYRQWLARLEEEADAAHPLYPLRAFFLQTVAGEQGLTIPEINEESRRAKIRDEGSRARLLRLGAECATVDSALLGRYFAFYVSEGTVPESGGRRPPVANQEAVRLDGLLPQLRKSLARELREPALTIDGISLTPVGGDGSIISELTSWREGVEVGLFRGVIRASSPGGSHESRVVVKVKPEDQRSLDMVVGVAELSSEALGRTMSQFRETIGLTRSHVRELEIYRLDEPRIRLHAPSVLATTPATEGHPWIAVMEELPTDALFKATSDDEGWPAGRVDAAIRGMSAVHSVWLGREQDLRVRTWLPPVRDSELLTAMTPLWTALADYAIEKAPGWRIPGMAAVHRRLVEQVAEWSVPLESLPRTLIHNDFNPRNIGIRPGPAPRLCAFDWEAATLGVPQRDLAELLTWTCSSSATRDEVGYWVERARVLLCQESGTELHRGDWELGFRAALAELLVDRLSMYAMVDHIRPQPYLPRVIRTWMALERLFPWGEA